MAGFDNERAGLSGHPSSWAGSATVLALDLMIVKDQIIQTTWRLGFRTG